MVGARECIGRQLLRNTKSELLVLHRAFSIFCVLIEDNRVLVSFPFGVERMVLGTVTNQVLISSHLRRRIAIAGIATTRIHEPELAFDILVSSWLFLKATNPAEELIAGANWGIGNGRCLIDLNILARVISISSVIIVPIDKGQSFFVLLNVLCLQLHRIGVLLAAIKMRGISNVTIFVGNPRVLGKHVEVITWEDIYT